MPMLSDSTIDSSFTARALRRNRKMLLLFAIPAPPMAIMTWTVAVATLDVTAFAMAALFSVVAFFSVRAYARSRDVTQSPLIRLLRERPGDIVWIYVHEQRMNGLVAQETVRVHGASRQLFILQSLEVPQLMAELRAWCPHAYVGWSQQLEDAWTRDPASLGRVAA